MGTFALSRATTQACRRTGGRLDAPAAWVTEAIRGLLPAAITGLGGAIAAGLWLAATALAQDGDLPSERPAPLIDALAAGAPVTQYDWTFTQTMAVEDGRIVVRHDPRDPARRWTLLEPAPEAASEGVLLVMQSLETGEPGRGLLGYDLLDEAIGDDVMLAREEAEALIYRFTPMADPQGARQARAFMRKLRGEILVSRSGAGADGQAPWIQSVRIYAPRSFKPSLDARIHSFEQTALYGLQNGVPLLQESTTAVAGSALFEPFEESVTVRISDAVPMPLVTPPPSPPAPLAEDNPEPPTADAAAPVSESAGDEPAPPAPEDPDPPEDPPSDPPG